MRNSTNILCYSFVMALIFPAMLFCQLAPTLQVTDGDGKLDDILLNDMKIDISVAPPLSTTRIEMTFYNPNNRILEGELIFPLAPGETINYLAYEIDGVLREASVVEKEKGRVVFETLVREGIDPALVEHVEGNVFRTRIYPVPAKGSKRIVIGFDQALTVRENATEYLLTFDADIVMKKCSIRAEVFSGETLPVPHEETNGFDRQLFNQWQQAWVAEAEYTNFSLKNARYGFKVVNDNPDQPVCLLETGGDGNTYFYFRTPVSLPSGQREVPHDILILWDESGSMTERDLEWELALLKAYYRDLEHVRFTLVPFRNQVEAAEYYPVHTYAEWEGFEKRLRNTAYDGGSTPGAIKFNSYECDEALLFSDLFTTIGPEQMPDSRYPVHVIASTAQFNTLAGQRIAARSGGSLLTSAKFPNTQECLNQLREVHPHRHNASVKSGKVDRLTFGADSEISGTLSFSGILQSGKAKIEVSFVAGDGQLIDQVYTLSDDNIVDVHGAVVRTWAQMEIARLEATPGDHRSVITGIAKEYGLVTEHTSLMVLDRVEDYVRFDVKPPDDLKDACEELIASQKREKENDKKAHLEHVFAMWQERIRWYETEFPSKVSMYPEEKEHLGRDPNDPLFAESLMEEEAEAVYWSGEDGGISTTSQDFDGPGSGNNEVRPLRMSREGAASLGGSATGGSGSRASSVSGQTETAEDEMHATATIKLAPWQPDSPYMNAIKEADPDDVYAAYLSFRSQNVNSTAFFLDVSDHLVKLGKPELGLRVLSNLAEMELENHELLRILGKRLQQLDQNDLAISIFEKVLEIRPEEPQSYRDLGLAYADAGQYQQAIDTLYVAVERPWDDRFPGIEIIILTELNNILGTCGEKLDMSRIDKRFIRNLVLDLRVVLEWDADQCDMDLWVTDPSNEKCFYQHRDTRTGGYMTNDFTMGYGPEEYVIRKALNGDYRVQVNYYGNHRQTLAGQTTITIHLFTGYGTGSQQVQEVTRRLDAGGEVVEVGAFSVEGTTGKE